jgi:hypothetical protein
MDVRSLLPVRHEEIVNIMKQNVEKRLAETAQLRAKVKEIKYKLDNFEDIKRQNSNLSHENRMLRKSMNCDSEPDYVNNESKRDSQFDEKENEYVRPIKNPLVVIVGIDKYDGQSDCINTKKDVDYMSNLFESNFNYNCHISDNHLTKSKLKSFLFKIIVEEDLHENSNKYDGIIVCLFAHCKPNGYDTIITSDGGTLSLLQIEDIFNNMNMEACSNIPKIFIVDLNPQTKEYSTLGGPDHDNYNNNNNNNNNVNNNNDNNNVTDHDKHEKGNVVWSNGTDDMLTVLALTDSHLLAQFLNETMLNKEVINVHASFDTILNMVGFKMRNNKEGDGDNSNCIQINKTTAYQLLFHPKE